MKLKYDNWKKITVEVYDKLKDLKTDINTEEEIIDDNVKVLSILCDCDENDILNLPLDKFKELIYKSEFLKNVPKVNLNDEYNINGVVYCVHRNLRTLTTAQYIDFQTLYKDKEVKLKNLLACFLIPKGRKYSEDYDVLEVADEIYKYMSIVDANSVMFFFTLQYQALTKVMLTSSIKEMKKMMKKEKNEMKKQLIEKNIQQLIHLKNLQSNGIGFI